MAKKILIINGPNLNMLGTREPEIYGKQTLDDIISECEERAGKLGLEVVAIQTNSEAKIIGEIQKARKDYAGIIINAAAFTHTSVAIMDALIAYGKPVIEVHLSHIFKREGFRHNSYIAKVAKGLICGLGGKGYLLALDAMAELV